MRLLPLLLIGALAADAAAQSSANGLEIKMASSSPAGLHVLAAPSAKVDKQIGASPNAKDFTMFLGTGAAPNLKVTRNGARGLPLTTVILVDLSPSYYKTFWAKETRPAIEAYVSDPAAAKDEFILLGFALNPSPFPMVVGAKLKDQLSTVRMGIATSVTGGLAAAFTAVTAEGVHGLRQVIVFTDGADEDKANPSVWEDVVAQANREGIRVSIVLPPEGTLPAESGWKQITKITKFSMDNPAYAQWVAATSGLGRLAEGSHGVKIVSRNTTEITTKMRDERSSMMSALLLEATQCGAERGKPIDIQIEYVPGAKREAWSGGVKLPAAAWNPGSDTPCPSACAKTCAKWEACIGGTCAPHACTNDGACSGALCLNGFCGKACSPTCADWQECKSGGCAARACAGDENCGAGSRCAKGMCTAPATKSSGKLIWILAGAGALLLLAALFVLFRKKPQTVSVVETPPEPMPTPEETKPAVKDSAGVDLDPLPETHLVAIGGWTTQGERWRLHKRKTIAGASSDASDGVDLVFGGIKQVSSRHAQFDLFPSGDLWVSDLGSSNGTFVNGKKVSGKERMKLVPGDQVKLSQNLILKVERPGASESDDMPASAPVADSPPAEPETPAAKHKAATKFDPGGR